MTNTYKESTAVEVIARELGLCKERLTLQIDQMLVAYDRPAVSNKQEIAIHIQDTRDKLKYSSSISSCQYQIDRNIRLFSAE